MAVAALLTVCSAFTAIADSGLMDGIEVSTDIFAVKGADTLRVDVLQPVDTGGVHAGRPAIIFLSGGGWEGQARRTAITDTYPLLPYFVHKGFVGIAADYRCDFKRARKSGEIPDRSIGDLVADSMLNVTGVVPAIDRAVTMAVDDLTDVTRYILDHADVLGVDPRRIVVVGSSAGAITALTAEHALCNRKGSAVRRLPRDFNYAAVIPMAGGVWCATGDTLRWKRRPCPLLMFHGDVDPIVSYTTLRVPSARWNMNGVKDIAAQMDRMGVPHTLYTLSGMNHDAAVVPMASHLDVMYNFLRQTVLEPEKRSRVAADVVQWPEGFASEGSRKAMEGVVRTTCRYKTVDGDTLHLDVFVAPGTVPAHSGKRPVLFYSYGGGWQEGHRLGAMSDNVDLTPYFARRGWVSVCYDYRHGFMKARKDGLIDDRSIVDFIVHGRFAEPQVWSAVQQSIDTALYDTADALAFVADNAGVWNADMERVVATGGSAGAINVLTLEYLMCSDTRPDITDRLPDGFRFAALAPMAGGVWYTGSEAPQWRRKPCPMMLFHGDADPVVPIDSVSHATSGAVMWGSRAVVRQLRDMKVPYAMYAVTGGDHTWANNPILLNLPDLERFIYRVLDCGEPLQLDIQETTPGLNRDPEWYTRFVTGR